MDKDWKDTLSALRGELNERDEESYTESVEPETKKDIQETPLTVVTDKKGRNGKVATIIEGFTIPQEEVEKIARSLKQKLGVGGSVRNGEILIQGDRKNEVKKFLSQMSYKVK